MEGSCLPPALGLGGQWPQYRLLKFSTEIAKTEKVVGILLSPSTKLAKKTVLESK